MAPAIFIGALKLGFKVRQEDACLCVVLDLGLVCLFAEKAMDQFKRHGGSNTVVGADYKGRLLTFLLRSGPAKLFGSHQAYFGLTSL
jgi:hypothetical protein